MSDARRLAGETRNSIRRQEILTELAMLALQYTTTFSLMREVAYRVTQALSTQYCEVLELMPDGDSFLLRAGTGWQEGYVGYARVGTNLDSQAGYTLISGEPVRVTNVKEESRFSDTPLLEAHSVRSGVTAAIYKQGCIYGVLGAHTTQCRMFSEGEASFLADVAEIIGSAMERITSEEEIRAEAAESKKRAEASDSRFRFLTDANAALSTCSRYDDALSCTVRMAVPVLADWCFIDVVSSEEENEDTLHRLTATRAEGARGSGEVVGEFQYHYSLSPEASYGTPKILRTGESETIFEVTDDVLEAITQNAEHLNILRNSLPYSFICVPLRVRRCVIGSLGLLIGGSGRHYSEKDLSVAEGLAYCAAIAIDRVLNIASQENTVQELIHIAEDNQTVVVNTVQDNATVLTSRQLELLKLISNGKSATEIKVELGLSEATVRGHIRSILRAFGAHSQLEAVARAREVGILPC